MLVAAHARIANSVIALNIETGGAAADCGGIGFLGTGINLISSTNQGTCSEAQPIVAANPLLGPLARNGGTLRRSPCCPAARRSGRRGRARPPPAISAA